ncbi:hypothetical protein TSAR_003939 [Trichomalopsis sarcophagae]|uniref:Uncharacterized protein n=1 Tax=Trichomalopsis sarcophagae TaxID=543379 RepID=A0A232FJ79_9HYME|nr:hypothetical protein TSAR_003939 [Trichomalopsis sarcophagae]
MRCFRFSANRCVSTVRTSALVTKLYRDVRSTKIYATRALTFDMAIWRNPRMCTLKIAYEQTFH